MINGGVVLYLLAIQRGAWENMERSFITGAKYPHFAVQQAAL